MPSMEPWSEVIEMDVLGNYNVRDCGTLDR